MDADIEQHALQLRQRVERRLAEWLPGEQTPPDRLRDAMRYATLEGGKRIRALLVYAAGEAVGAELPALDVPACAVELVHAYSLVHDDLPAMDDDQLRRGKPTCHIQFDEATAILAGDALQTLAFEVLARGGDSALAPKARVAMVAALAAAGGPAGMAGGQMLDLLATGRDLEIEELETVHSRKTGALIDAAVTMGALANPATGDAQLAALKQYASAIGLAFQIIDDVLDESSDTATLGKTSGADRRMGKSTYPAILGIDASKREAARLYQQAIASISTLGDNTALLQYLAERIIRRLN